jgi:hypothetical protein
MNTTRNHRIRFAENNFARLISSQIDFSSELSSFPFTNCINPFRSRAWKPSGNFTITLNVNDKIYINDGINKTITLTPGDYNTPELFRAHLQTRLNASSSNWTVLYDTLVGDYRFKITNTGSVTLRLSQTTNSAWDTIGFTTLTDLVGTTFMADQQRNHSEEYAIFDLGYNAEVTFFALIGALDEVFTISNNATVTLSGSNLNQWSAPPFSISIPITDKGAMRFLDDQPDTAYRFWRLSIIDRANPLGPEGISIGVLYLGDFVTFTNANIAVGFNSQDVDPSDVAISESGVLHFDKKVKYSRISGAGVDILEREDKDRLKALYEYLGSTTPFFLSIDPTLCITDEIDEFTKYVVFDSEPTFRHLINDLFGVSLEFKEVV